MENLRQVAHAPSVQMHDVPPDLISIDGLDEPDPDVRSLQEDEDRRSVPTFSPFLLRSVLIHVICFCHRVEPQNEYYDGDRDNDKEDGFLDV